MGKRKGAASWSGRRRKRRMVDGVYLHLAKWPLMIEPVLLDRVRAAAVKEGVTLSLWIGKAIEKQLGK